VSGARRRVRETIGRETYLTIIGENETGNRFRRVKTSSECGLFVDGGNDFFSRAAQHPTDEYSWSESQNSLSAAYVTRGEGVTKTRCALRKTNKNKGTIIFIANTISEFNGGVNIWYNSDRYKFQEYKTVERIEECNTFWKPKRFFVSCLWPEEFVDHISVATGNPDYISEAN